MCHKCDCKDSIIQITMSYIDRFETQMVLCSTGTVSPQETTHYELSIPLLNILKLDTFADHRCEWIIVSKSCNEYINYNNSYKIDVNITDRITISIFGL